jgi:hypothetical protein
MVYLWKTGARINADPEEAAQVMNALAKEGRLNAETLVEVSKPEDAPLHKAFEWDDTIAAEKWRCHQGRHIINAIVVVNEDEPQKEPIRAYFKVETNGGQYEPTEVLIQTVDGQQALKEMAKKELAAFRSKYQNILAWCGADQLIMDAVSMLDRKAQ